jgi:hypothetical protein
MQEGQLPMTLADRDRLVALKKAGRQLITQREAAGELGLSVRQGQRLLAGLKQRGGKAEAVRILSAPVCEGFGPTLAAEYLSSRHGIEAGKETVRRVGTVGRQRARLAGRAAGALVSDRDDRRRHQPAVCPVRGELAAFRIGRDPRVGDKGRRGAAGAGRNCFRFDLSIEHEFLLRPRQ